MKVSAEFLARKLKDGDHSWSEDAASMLESMEAQIDSLEKDCYRLIGERDYRDEVIDKLLDMVLGDDRTEWSSIYDFGDALIDVECVMKTLKKDAERWREAVMYIGAENQLGAARYVIRGIDAPINVMRGSVSEHFTKSIDAALQSQGAAE